MVFSSDRLPISCGLQQDFSLPDLDVLPSSAKHFVIVRATVVPARTQTFNKHTPLF